MDISVVEGDTVPILLTLTDIVGPVFSLGSTITFEVDLPSGTVSSTGSIDSPLGDATITPSAAQTARPGVFPARVVVASLDYPSTRHLKFSVLGHTRGHTAAPTVPALAILDRSGTPILDRTGDYILSRAA